MNHEHETIDTGPAAAAFVAAGLGCAALGLFTTLAEASAAVKNFLNWWNPAGPLTGKTGVAVAIWIVAWIILQLAWRGKSISVNRAFAATIVLIGLGAVGTFPVFFEAFGH